MVCVLGVWTGAGIGNAIRMRLVWWLTDLDSYIHLKILKRKPLREDWGPCRRTLCKYCGGRNYVPVNGSSKTIDCEGDDDGCPGGCDASG